MAALLQGLFLFLRPSVCLFSFPPGPVRLQGSRMSLLFMSLVFFLFLSSLVTGRLPFYRLYDLRLPHAGQTVLCARPDERRRPALPSVSARRLQRTGDAFLRRRSHSR